MTDKDHIYQTTLEDIEKLKKVQLANVESIKTLTILKRERQLIIDRTTRKVYTDTDEQGNKRFTNETMRKTEVTRQLTESEEYQTWEKDIEEIDTNIHRSS